MIRPPCYRQTVLGALACEMGSTVGMEAISMSSNPIPALLSMTKTGYLLFIIVI
jgi:hypothetical protein